MDLFLRARTIQALFTASVIAILSVFAIVSAQIFVDSSANSGGDIEMQGAAYYLLVLVATVSMFSQFGLWICMLGFTLRFDRLSNMRKIVIMLMQLGLLSMGSVFVYFAVYRPAFKARLAASGSEGEL